MQTVLNNKSKQKMSSIINTIT